MRLSQLFFPTMKETPAEAEIASHRLMLRAGMIRKLSAGLYSWLPLGLRVIQKIEAIIRQELNLSGAQEVLLPFVQPATLWQETERWEHMGAELLRLQDRHARDFCLGPTHEEVITDMVRQEVKSYRQLPLNLYQIQLKFRDEIRPRFGVMRAREFIMMDAYSFHDSPTSFQQSYADMYSCFSRILTKMDLNFVVVIADSGNIGDGNSHEFHVLAESGEDTLVVGESGGYMANLERAECALPIQEKATVLQELQEVDTPGQRTINAICKFFNADIQTTVKTLIVGGANKELPLVALVLRGDHVLNEAKAARLDAVASPLRYATEDEVKAKLGVGFGSIGPRGLPLPVYVDRSAAVCANFICGANTNDRHLIGVNWSRDLELATDRVVDLRNVTALDRSPDGKESLRLTKGIEVGHIFQLNAKYSAPMQATIQCQDGTERAMLMGCYGMGVTRLVGAIIEQHHDQLGICWPQSIAPFVIVLVPLGYQKSSDIKSATDKLYQQLQESGVEVLLDDRDNRAGVKFAETELLGIPWRLVISSRGLKNQQYELYQRATQATRYIAASGASHELIRILNQKTG